MGHPGEVTRFDAEVEEIVGAFEGSSTIPFVREYLTACQDDLGLVLSGPGFGPRKYVNVKPPDGGARLAAVTSPNTGRAQIHIAPSYVDRVPLAEVVLNNGIPRRLKVMLTSSEAVASAVELTRLAAGLNDCCRGIPGECSSGGHCLAADGSVSA